VAHTVTRLAIVAAWVLGSLILVQVVHAILRPVGRRVIPVRLLARRAFQPFRVTVALATLTVALRGSGIREDWRSPVEHILLLLVIGSSAWLLAALLFVIEDAAMERFRTDVQDNRHARTVRTQITLLRRVTVAAVTVIAIGAMLMTFREARIVGTSILASAGVVAAVTAFAAQALLGNVLAGLQLAFGKSLRLDDVVVVEQEWGRVETITLTYVVVHVWDDRRMIFPTSYFTTTPFQNWTHSESSLLGSIELETDWTVPVEAMREELRVVLTGTDLWDKRVNVLQVIDALGGQVRLRALVSAVDAPTLWDLRCHVRERLVGWLRAEHPEALPRSRIDVGSAQRQTHVRDAPMIRSDGRARVFGGDADGRERGIVFHGRPDHVSEDLGGTDPENG
jgi:small-conductance mechanosensitive channel